MTRLRKTLIGVALAVLLGLVAHVNHYKFIGDPKIYGDGSIQVWVWDRWTQRACIRIRVKVEDPLDRVFGGDTIAAKVIVKTTCL